MKYSGPPVILPDAETLSPSQQGTIHLSNTLSSSSQKTTVLPHLRSASLISLGQICDSDCTVVMNNTKLYAVKSNNIKIDIDENNIVMKGHRNHRDGLYDIPLETQTIQQNNFVMPKLHPIYKFNVEKPTFETLKTNHISFTPKMKQTVNNMTTRKFTNIISPFLYNNTKNYVPVAVTTPKLNVILRKDKTKEELVKFLHGAVCSPTSPTWIKAINNNHFTTWPGLTSKLVTKHLPPSIATTEGHIKQEQKM